MYTQCPECLSVFSLGAQELVQAHGYVECGHCGAHFDSLATLTEQLPAKLIQGLPLNTQALAPPCVDLVVYRPRALAPESEPEPPVVVEATPAAAAPDDLAQLTFAPRFAKSRRAHKPPRVKRIKHKRHRVRRWSWVSICTLLALLLGAQLAWAGRDTLIRTPLTGHWLRSLCVTFDCRLPLVAAPQQLRLLASNVETHPNAAHALMISLSLRNDARFAQPWPTVVVTLEDAQGHTVAMRRLSPADYLDDGDILARGLTPGATTAVLLEVEDPGEQAVAYDFAFE